MKKIKFYSLISIVIVLMVSCGTSSRTKKSGVLKIPAGANVPSAGMAFDVSYDKKTDGIIPGYRILSVAITNNSIDIVQMDRASDKWAVKDYRGREHAVITNLKERDPDTFIKLPDRLRKLISYPILIQVGETRIIDLLVKDNVILDGFRSVSMYAGSTGRQFEIVASE